MYTPPAERTTEMIESLKVSDDYCERLLNADAFVFAMPMYNFTIPSVFKAYIDNVVRLGVTFVATTDNQYVGQLSRQKVLFITTRGGDLSPGSPLASYDVLTPALRTAFGFIGVHNPTFVDAQPLQFSEQEARQKAFEKAKDELKKISYEWTQYFNPQTE